MCFFGVDEVILFEFSVGNFFGELVDMGESEIESGESDGIGEPDGGGGDRGVGGQRVVWSWCG